jgi:hypothetical protein
MPPSGMYSDKVLLSLGTSLQFFTLSGEIKDNAGNTYLLSIERLDTPALANCFS